MRWRVWRMSCSGSGGKHGVVCQWHSLPCEKPGLRNQLTFKMSTGPFKFHLGISVLHLLLVQATLVTETITLRREAARLPSTCPSALPSAWNTGLLRRKTGAWAGASPGPSCPRSSASHTSQGFGSARLWQGVAFPALGDASRDAVRCARCQEWGSCRYPVHTLLRSYEDSHENPTGDQVYRTQNTDKWTSSGASLALGRGAGQAGELLGG